MTPVKVTGIDYTKISAATEITTRIVYIYRSYYFFNILSYLISTSKASRY